MPRFTSVSTVQWHQKLLYRFYFRQRHSGSSRKLEATGNEWRTAASENWCRDKRWAVNRPAAFLLTANLHHIMTEIWLINPSKVWRNVQESGSIVTAPHVLIAEINEYQFRPITCIIRMFSRHLLTKKLGIRLHTPAKFGLSVVNVWYSLHDASENWFCLRHPVKMTSTTSGKMNQRFSQFFTNSLLILVTKYYVTNRFITCNMKSEILPFENLGEKINN